MTQESHSPRHRAGAIPGSTVSVRPMAAGRTELAWMQRGRILDAMVEVASERGYAGASVGAVIARAGVSRRVFYTHFTDLGGCFAAVLDQGSEWARDLVLAAYTRRETWQEGVRWALASLLVLLDSKPRLARVWLVESRAAEASTLKHREGKMAELLAVILEPWPLPGAWRPAPLAAEGAFASVRGIVENHLLAPDGQPLIELLGPLMGLATAPFLDHKEAAREIDLGETLAREILAKRVSLPCAPAVQDIEVASQTRLIPAMLRNANAHRARQCLLFVAAHPVSSNQKIAKGIGVGHKGQVSTLLRHLSTLGLVSKHDHGAGHTTTWRTTPAGEQVAQALAASLPPNAADKGGKPQKVDV